MIFTQNTDLRTTVFNNIRQSVDNDREGTHLSDCIYCIRKAFFKKVGLYPEPSDETCLLWLSGFAYQQYMFPNDEEVTYIKDGISCTPDINTGIEVKSTRMSLGKFAPEEQVMWNRQILGYMKILGLLEYDLSVFFVCGDYKPPFPNIDCWHVEATQEEVDANWEYVLDNARKLQEALDSGIPPEPTCEDFEWKFCDCIDGCPDTYCWRMKYMGKGRRKK